MESTGELNNRFNLPHASRAWARAGNSIEIPLSFQPPPPPVGQLVPDITALLFFTCVHKETAHQFNCSQNGMVLTFLKMVTIPKLYSLRARYKTEQIKQCTSQGAQANAPPQAQVVLSPELNPGPQ